MQGGRGGEERHALGGADDGDALSDDGGDVAPSGVSERSSPSSGDDDGLSSRGDGRIQEVEVGSLWMCLSRGKVRKLNAQELIKVGGI